MAYEYDERYPEQLHPIAFFIATYLSKFLSFILGLLGK